MPTDLTSRKMRRSFVRTPLACDICRSRKTKCDGVRPRCGFCVRKDIQCSWPMRDVTSGAHHHSPGQALQIQVASQGALSDYLSSPVAGGPAQTPSSRSSLLADTQAGGGLDICLELFFRRHFLVDFCSFAYQPDFEGDCRHSASLAASVVALCGRYLESSDAQARFGLPTGQHVSREYTLKARELCKANSDQPSVSNIQSNLILARAELLSSSGSRHWLFTGSAIRMAEMMRLNKDFHQKHSLRDQEVRRRTYWACFLLDRALAYLLGKHRTINLETISIPLPDAHSALVYQEASRGVTLTNIAEQQRPSDLGIVPYLIKTVCVWGDMADLAIYSWRRSDPYPPADPRSKFAIGCAALDAWRGSIPLSLFWSLANYENQKALGQERGFVACHLLLQSAFCVAHQCYLPQVTTYAQVVDVPDAAGLSYLHHDSSIINICVSAALETGSIISTLVDNGESSSLQSIWTVSAILITANAFLWLQYAENIEIQNHDAREKGKQYFELIREILLSWSSAWPSSRRWLRTLDVMHDLYKAAYLGEISNHILDSDIDPLQPDGGGEFPSAANEDEDFNPQPGDGYPSVVSLPNLQASLKFATGDSSAKSISILSVWLQLSSGWPLGISQVEAILRSCGEANFDDLMEMPQQSPE